MKPTKSHPLEPLIPIAGMPWLPGLSQMLGYPGNEPRVAFFHCGDGFCWCDGTHTCGTANLFAWYAYSRDRVNLRYERNYRLAGDDWYYGYWLLVDEQQQRLHLGSATQVLQALGWPLPDSLGDDPEKTLSRLVESVMVVDEEKSRPLKEGANAYGAWIKSTSEHHRMMQRLKNRFQELERKAAGNGNGLNKP